MMKTASFENKRVEIERAKRSLLPLGIVALLAVTLYVFSRASPAKREVIPSSALQAAARLEASRTIAYRGVSFAYSPSLASEPRGITEVAYQLESPSDTGQGVVPEHIAFKFAGPYASRHEASFFSPEIHVYAIAQYEEALSKSPHYVKAFDEKVQVLKTMLSEQPATWDKEIPFLPFSIGGSQRFHARLEYLNFQNGKGVSFLTQYNIEPALINNQGLTYAYQGLTSDGLYYVSATFPVALPSLPDTYESEETSGFKLVPPQSFRGAAYESFERDYQIYLDELSGELKHLSPERFQPNLKALQDVIRSLSVKPEL